MTTKLMDAAFTGNVKLVRELIGTYAKCRDQEGRTALMLAAQEGYVEIVEMLAPYEIGQADEDGWTALMYASWSGSWDCVRYLSHQEARMQDSSGWTALMSAAWNGHMEVANYLYSEEVCMQDVDGWTALMCAAWNGHLDVVKLLYEREKGMVDKKGWTALMSAAWNGHYNVTKFLMNAEARRMDPYGWTALMSAVWNNHGNIVELLIDVEGSLIMENSKAMRMVSVARKNDTIILPTGQQEYLYSNSVVHTSTDPDNLPCLNHNDVDICEGDLTQDDMIESLQQELKAAHNRIQELEILAYETDKFETDAVSEEVECNEICDSESKCWKAKYDESNHEVEALNKTIRLMKQELDRLRNEHQQSQSVLDTLLTSSEDHELVKLVTEVQKLNNIIVTKDKMIKELKEKITEQEKTFLLKDFPVREAEKPYARRIKSVSEVPRRQSEGLRISLEDCSDIRIEAPKPPVVPVPANVPRGIRKKSMSSLPFPPNEVAVPLAPRESDDFSHMPHYSLNVSSSHSFDKPEVETLLPIAKKPDQISESTQNKNISYYEDKSLNSFFQEPSESSCGADGSTVRHIIREFAKVKKELEQIKRQQISMGRELQSTKNETDTLRMKIGAKATDPEDLKLAITDLISTCPQILVPAALGAPPGLNLTAVCSPCGHRITTTDPETISKCPHCNAPARAISLDS